MPHFILTMSLDESIGIFLRATPLTPVSQEMPPRKKKEAEHGDVFSAKEGSVGAHLRGMRLAPTNQKDTLTPRENSNIKNFESNSNCYYNTYF